MNLSFYRPNRDQDKGFAIQLNRGTFKGVPAVYIEAAKQVGEKGKPGSTDHIFDWENKLVIKLNIDEIGLFLAVAEGRTNQLDLKDGVLLHTTDEGRSTAKFGQGTNGYSLSVSCDKQREKGDLKFNGYVRLGAGDVANIRAFMTLAAQEYFNAVRRRRDGSNN